MLFFFFNDTATTEIYTLSLHDALPICVDDVDAVVGPLGGGGGRRDRDAALLLLLHPVHRRGALVDLADLVRSEEHTSELQSLAYLVCRLLLEKKKTTSSIALTCNDGAI